MPVVQNIAPPTAAAESCYRVWAPQAMDVTLALQSARVPMTRRTDGWWISDRAMRAGELYGYLIDDEGPFPDPRSSFQPAGVHGWSQCVDHHAFVWSDTGWQAPPLGSGVLYEMHVGTFSEAGTFAGAMAKLSHLVDLGVTHVELMPVSEFSGHRGWGYDGVDLFAPHHAYGSPEDLKRLVNTCHARGLAVILDVVYNHLGPIGNYLGKFGPYFTSRYATPWGQAVNLDGPGSDEVRRFFCDNAVMWLRDYHIDGLRLDAVHALIDGSARHFLEQLSEEVETLEATAGRHYDLVAESDLNDPRVIRARDAGGFGIDAQWSDDFHHALHSLLTGDRSGYYEDFGTFGHLAKALQHAFVYAGAYSPHRDRRHGRLPVGAPGWRFIVAAQNHDQVGNRAAGERLTHLASIPRLKMAAAIVLMSPFVPLLFQGEEWGASTPFLYFTAHEDDAVARQVSEGRRNEFAAFGWDPANVPDPQSATSFERSRLRWEEVNEPRHTDLLSWYRALVQLRRRHQFLRDGRYWNTDVVADEEQRLLVIRRDSITLACNLGDAPATTEIRSARVVLASDTGIDLCQDTLYLPPDSVAVLEIIGR
jgi:maltooligosyltrehalose trehalohydrolase